jgi:hypothetical protein
MDMQTIFIIVVIALLIMYLINRNQSRSGYGSGNPLEPGNERPRYDDPDIEGRGSFGRDNDAESSSYMPRSSPGRDAVQPRPTRDSDNIRGRGGFGKDKR